MKTSAIYIYICKDKRSKQKVTMKLPIDVVDLGIKISQNAV